MLFRPALYRPTLCLATRFPKINSCRTLATTPKLRASAPEKEQDNVSESEGNNESNSSIEGVSNDINGEADGSTALGTSDKGRTGPTSPGGRSGAKGAKRAKRAKVAGRQKLIDERVKVDSKAYEPSDISSSRETQGGLSIGEFMRSTPEQPYIRALRQKDRARGYTKPIKIRTKQLTRIEAHRLENPVTGKPTKHMRRGSTPSNKAIKTEPKPTSLQNPGLCVQAGPVQCISTSQLCVKPVEFEKVSVPSLCHGLDRVLFNPGIYHLQDPRSRVYNFDPFLEKIMPIQEFNWDVLPPYITSSRDERLADVARAHGKKYICTTSSTTHILSHFHFLLSQWREIEWRMLTKDFPTASSKFTSYTRAPSAIFLRWRNGVYAIDADKEYDEPIVLSKLGHSLEKLLTVPAHQFKKYSRLNPEQLPQEHSESTSYHFSTIGDFLMRSQLDAHDPRLPGTGMFDLKTRAAVSIRMNTRDDLSQHTGYQIRYRQGEWESYEREYHDLVRTTMLKYSLQVRMGRMDGIFVAYHNIERIFGFQYLGLPEMDEALHNQSDTSLGDEEFKLSMKLFNEILERAVAKFPEQSIRFHFETREAVTPFMYIYAEPISENEIEAIQKQADLRQKAYDESLQSSSVSEVPLDEEASMEWQKIQQQVASNIEEDQTGSQDTTYSALDTPAPASPTMASEEDGNLEQELEQKQDTLTGQSDNERDHNASPSENVPETMESTNEEVIDPKSAEKRNTNTDAGETAGNENSKDLLAMILIIRNKVNGQYVTRPENFTKQDLWEVEYTFSEVKNPEERYQACLYRRRRAAEHQATESWNAYRQLIRNVSDKSRAWREVQDEIDEKIGTIVYNPLDGSLPVGKDTITNPSKR